MRFLLKATGAVMVVAALSLGVVLAQRLVTPPLLEAVVYTSPDCGANCWFGVPVDGSMHHRAIRQQLEAEEGTHIQLRGYLMRGRLHAPRMDGLSHVQFALNSDGRAIQTCFFPSQVAVHDVVAAFGSPDRVVLDSLTRRAIYNRGVLQHHHIAFSLIYLEPNIVVTGTTFLPSTTSPARLALETRVTQMCTPGYSDQSVVRSLPEWQGFLHDAGDYITFAPDLLSLPDQAQGR